MTRPRIRCGFGTAKSPLKIPRGENLVVLEVDGKDVRLTNLQQDLLAGARLTKGDLLQYYANVADVLLPHLRDRAMVMKRYPHGASGPSSS